MELLQNILNRVWFVFLANRSSSLSNRRKNTLYLFALITRVPVIANCDGL